VDREKRAAFIRKTESLVKPEDVTAISFLGDFNKLLPKKTQDSIMRRGTQSIPYMGFIVDPYCLFLSYEVKDLEAARALLPPGDSLAETSFCRGDPAYPMVVISAFSARTSAFIGARLEFYLIARNDATGMVSWIILDYETNTNSHDPKRGFTGYSSDPTVFAVDSSGELLVDFAARGGKASFSATADLEAGRPRELETSLWVEGNLSIDYGGELAAPSSTPFGLIFDPDMMRRAMELPVDAVKIRCNGYLAGLIDPLSPRAALFFPYSQHFVIRQGLSPAELRDEAGLSREMRTFLDAAGFKTMRGDDIRRPLLRGMAASSILNALVIIFLFIKAFFF